MSSEDWRAVLLALISAIVVVAAPIVVVYAEILRRRLKEVVTTTVQLAATTEKQGEKLEKVADVAADAHKLANGLNKIIAAAKLAEGIGIGELKERDRADAKAEANKLPETR
jgi:hypothetical protein